MKWLVTALTLVFAFNVHAADKKIGNLIAVERTIENVYSACIDQIEKSPFHKPSERLMPFTFV